MKNITITDNLINTNPYELDKGQKKVPFTEALLDEIKFHYDNNEQYQRFCDNKDFNPHSFEGGLDQIPPIAVSVFKDLGKDLKSVPDSEVKLSLQSSATSGVPSTVVLDKITAKRQGKVMIKVIKDFIGAERKPFIVVDVSPKPENIKFLGARYAAIGGYLNFASDVNYALDTDSDESVSFNVDKTKAFIASLDKETPMVVFGFTYMLYAQVVKPLLDKGITFDLPKGSKIIHIGGWKKLESEKIGKAQFNKAMSQLFSVKEEHVIDIYGFTEQMGLNYPDCECGWKHTPVYSEVIVRNPVTREVMTDGEEGVLEFLSPIPHSYPGNVVLTDDMGVVNPEPCPIGRNGTRFKILGRLKKAEVRGCGDILGSKLKFSGDSEEQEASVKSDLELHYWKGDKIDTSQSTELQLKEIIRNLNSKKEWLRSQPIDALIGLIGEASKVWMTAEGDLSAMKEKGLSFLANWAKPIHLNRIATIGLRNNRQHIDGFIPLNGSRKQFLKANQKGLVCHWLAGNVQVLGMFALLQAIMTKNVNLLKISSKDGGVFAGLLKTFEGISFTTKGGYTIKGDDLLETIAVVYFSHRDREIGELMSKSANVRIAWGGREAVETVANYPSMYDTEDIIFGPKISFSVISQEVLSTERKAKKIARKVAVDSSVFDQTGCASPHNLYIERGGVISPREFCNLLAQGMEKTSVQIPKGETSVEQISAIHSVRGLYDFKGEVWASDDTTWTVVYSEDKNLRAPVYSRVIMVHPVDHIDETLEHIDDNIQTIGLASIGEKALNFAEKAVDKGVMRCPEMGRMLNFESPWDGIFLMERMVRWSTFGGPLI
ncbi:acyl-CoA reductase [uncultured Winogradskyella sp.]|uniref:LuxE/PaaK family acyltransferase n=1 Tax=uncultured Winogradskyella sp. TaxID=395353 RepID=UPI00261E4FB2|nr:acyl-CoA reductase [uncultured Winogradskyella sp.]|tara:strand:+ start:10197 stop:12680 length:2484 start_codon:yes stop_codon:yes gene_type:complete